MGQVFSFHARKLIVVGVAALGATMLVVTAQAAGHALSGAELKRLSGAFQAEWKGHKARVQLNRDGTLVARAGTKVDKGRWQVKGNQLCIAFRVWTRGKYKCGTVRRQGKWYVGLHRDNGEPRLRFRR